jgi:hypothetical protein
METDWEFGYLKVCGMRRKILVAFNAKKVKQSKLQEVVISSLDAG